MIDAWHFFRGSSTWDDLERVPLEQVAYVQFADAPEPVSADGMAETMDRRVLPGDGVFEVLSAELRGLPIGEFAAAAYTATARYWLGGRAGA